MYFMDYEQIKSFFTYIAHKPFYLFNTKLYKYFFSNSDALYKYNPMALRKRINSNSIRYERYSSFYPANYIEENLDYKAAGNTGNFIFTRALETYLIDKDLYYNVPGRNNAGICIVNCANLLGEHGRREMKLLTSGIKTSPCKFYFIGLGAQAPIDYSFNLSDDTKKIIKNFIKAILNSGGGIGLRGFYTAELLCKLGFSDSDFDVIGCPSMYINGRNFQLYKDESITLQCFRPIICDRINSSLFNKSAEKLFTDYESTYICQDECYPYLYRGKSLPDSLNTAARQMFYKNRVKLFLDVDAWIKEIRNHNFSFGCRFHGNALAITNSVPAVINVIDSRTRELAEFFNIPYVKTIDYEEINLYEIYQNADYRKFNEGYKAKFDNFKAFFTKHRIPNYVGEKNPFINWLRENKANPLFYNFKLEEAQTLVTVERNVSISANL